MDADDLIAETHQTAKITQIEFSSIQSNFFHWLGNHRGRIVAWVMTKFLKLRLLVVVWATVMQLMETWV